MVLRYEPSTSLSLYSARTVGAGAVGSNRCNGNTIPASATDSATSTPSIAVDPVRMPFRTGRMSTG